MSANPRKIRKAAILVASLDREAADIVMNQMAPLEARLVRRAMVELGSPDPVEQNDVIEDFFRTAPRVRRDDLEGIELGDNLLPPARSTVPHSALDARTNSSLAFLKGVTADPLAPLLERERPQTIAVVLSHLSPKAAAELLARLPAALQVEVTHCMLELDQIDASALTALEEGVALWLRQHAQVHAYRGETATDGRVALEQILAIASAETRQNMLAAMPEENRIAESAALQLPPTVVPQQTLEPTVRTFPSQGRRPLDFERFCQLDPVTAAGVVVQAYPEVAALALVGADENFSEQVLEQMPRAEANQIRANLQDLGPTSLADVELAQNEIVRLAEQRDLKKHGDTVSSSRLSVVG